MSDTLLEVKNLSKRFLLHERQKRLVAFQGLEFEAKEGEILVFIGASGSGKSSILRCIYRTYLPSSGEIRYRDRHGKIIDLASVTPQEILLLRRQEIRFVSQFLNVLPRQTTLDVVAKPLRELGTSTEAAQQSACQLLQQIGLPEHLWSIPPHTFSGGERQLVNLARALIVEPRLLLLDEPAASLDPTSTEQVIRSIEGLRRTGMAVISVFHDMEIVERIADRTIRMQGGVNWDQHQGIETIKP